MLQKQVELNKNSSIVVVAAFGFFTMSSGVGQSQTTISNSPCYSKDYSCLFENNTIYNSSMLSQNAIGDIIETVAKKSDFDLEYQSDCSNWLWEAEKKYKLFYQKEYEQTEKCLDFLKSISCLNLDSKPILSLHDDSIMATVTCNGRSFKFKCDFDCPNTMFLSVFKLKPNNKRVLVVDDCGINDSESIMNFIENNI